VAQPDTAATTTEAERKRTQPRRTFMTTLSSRERMPGQIDGVRTASAVTPEPLVTKRYRMGKKISVAASFSGTSGKNVMRWK